MSLTNYYDYSNFKKYNVFNVKDFIALLMPLASRYPQYVEDTLAKKFLKDELIYCRIWVLDHFKRAVYYSNYGRFGIYDGGCYTSIGNSPDRRFIEQSDGAMKELPAHKVALYNKQEREWMMDDKDAQLLPIFLFKFIIEYVDKHEPRGHNNLYDMFLNCKKFIMDFNAFENKTNNNIEPPPYECDGMCK